MQRVQLFAAAAAAVVLAWSLAAAAAGESDTDELRKQIEQMKQEQEEQIKALEKRLQETEQKAGQAQQKTDQVQQQAGAAASSEANTGQQQRPNAFNPAISLLLQGRYANLSQDPNTYEIVGFIPTEGDVGPGSRGFSLQETELTVAANVDPYFGGQATISLGPDDNSVDVEEAYFYTLALGKGITVKAGRFFSAVGYLNQFHQHAWDFIDAPLPYRSFLAEQLDDDAVQLKWVAPTRLLVELGAEAGRGRQFPGSDQDKNGIGLTTLFGHVGGDVGVSHSWGAGLSYVTASPNDRTYQDTDSTGTVVTNAFSGDSKTLIADFVWKWAPKGNPTVHNFKFQTEYFYRHEDGTLTFDTEGAATGPTPGSYDSRQSGWYVQAVYQFMPKWRAGVRYDRLDRGTVDIGQVQSGVLPAADFPVLGDHTPTLWTVMLDWSLSEFSRFRLQYAQDHSRANATDNQLFFQYIMSLGSHGAHTW